MTMNNARDALKTLASMIDIENDDMTEYDVVRECLDMTLSESLINLTNPRMTFDASESSLTHIKNAFTLLFTERECVTQLALELSLCPLHFIDYAICFDDEDEECKAIRQIHPSHDH
jgi:hypothetical protein